jgi:hypothetical protein
VPEQLTLTRQAFIHALRFGCVSPHNCVHKRRAAEAEEGRRKHAAAGSARIHRLARLLPFLLRTPKEGRSACHIKRSAGCRWTRSNVKEWRTTHVGQLVDEIITLIALGDTRHLKE